MKRWCDKGDVETQYTSGGHRRISTTTLLRFLRESHRPLVHPEILGLPGILDLASLSETDSAAELCNALLALDEDRCREINSALYLSGKPVLEICENVIARALNLIGDRWECGEAEVYHERRGCEIAALLVHDLRRLLPVPPAAAPLAIGGGISGDPYRLPTLMVETVLRELGWRAISLGENIPLSSFATATRALQPRLVWFSLSYITDEDALVDGYRSFYADCGRLASIAVGGQAVNQDLLRRIPFSVHCPKLADLPAFVKSIEPLPA
ncbi:B12-binding domain-containing protein [Rubinisphaera sp. ICM_H10]|nr:B12-binding domain-containing protein [Rubinisphaera margarita]